MRRRRTVTFLGLVGVLGLLGSCSPAWRVRTAEAPSALQWPFHPAPAKVTFVRSITGFSRTAGVGSALSAIVYGKDPKDADALVLPVAAATARDGRIAVADLGRAAVHLFIPAEGRYRRLTGPKGSPLRTPVAVAFDDDLRLWVSDSSGSVQAFDPEGAPLLTIREAGSAPLRRPTGLAWSPKTKLLYVVDTLAHTIFALDARGGLVRTIGGRGDDEGRFNFPTHLTLGGRGDLYVTDSLNFRIQILDENGGFVGAFGRHGDGSGDLAMPKGLAVDDDGVVYLADSLFDVVQLFGRDGTFLLTLGRRGVDFGEFWVPAGVFMNEKDELYVCDTYNHRVQVFRVARGYGDAAR